MTDTPETRRAALDALLETDAMLLDDTPVSAEAPAPDDLISVLATQSAELTRLTAEVERLRAALRGAYEVYAGSDGFIPETAAEGYQQQIIKQMVDAISAALKEPAHDD